MSPRDRLAFLATSLRPPTLVRDDVVWDIVQIHLPVLRADAAALLADLDPSSDGD